MTAQFELEDIIEEPSVDGYKGREKWNWKHILPRGIKGNSRRRDDTVDTKLQSEGTISLANRTHHFREAGVGGSESAPYRLWFDRLNTRFGIPLLLGVFLVAFLPFYVFLMVGYWTAGLWRDFVSQFLPIAPFFYVFILYDLFAARFVSVRARRLIDYAQSMGLGDASASLGSLHSLKRTLVFWLVFTLVVEPFVLIFSSSQYTITQRILTQLPFLFFLFLQASFLWPYFDSMFMTYRIGKRPLTLRFYAEDRTLGLRPFGTLSLQLTTLYSGLFALIFFIVLVSGVPLFAFVFPLIAFMVLGLLFFVLPLISLHGKMIEAKRSLIVSITPRFARISRAILEAKGEQPLEGSLVSELMAIDKVQKDINEVHTWPFDISILSRLATVLILPPFLSVLARIIILVVLRI